MSSLTLVPTPIDDHSPLEPVALELLKKATKDSESIICVEDAKPGRRRWLHWGLPREAIESFVLYNEHTRKEEMPRLLSELQKGNKVFLLSDGGLPAFCDPGKELVNACHENKIKVTSTPFSNSISLAVALSGFDHDKFIFRGFLPVKKEERSLELKEVLASKWTQIIMDTPYRLSRTLEELTNLRPELQVFVALDLNHPNETLLRGRVSQIASQLKGQKAEFILVISQ